MNRLFDYLKARAAATNLAIALHARVQTPRGRRILDLLLLPWGLLRWLLTPIFRLFGAGRRKYRLTAVAIVKNEAPYLAEWIAYHRLIGVNHFCIYDNDSTDATREVLAPYIADGTVFYRRLPGRLRQYDAYNHALLHFGKTSEYMLFLDLDEFLYSADGDPLSHLTQIFARNRHIGGVAINWAIFGSAHRVSMPEGLVIESYTLRGEESFEKNRHVKTLCRPESVVGFINPHAAVYGIGKYAVTVAGVETYGPLTEQVLFEPVRINHYFTKSLAEFALKRNRGKADNPTPRDMNEFNLHDVNDILDEGMLAFIDGVRARLPR